MWSVEVVKPFPFAQFGCPAAIIFLHFVVGSAQRKDRQMKKRFSDEQIIAMLKEQEAGERTADVCWRHGISQATFYI